MWSNTQLNIGLSYSFSLLAKETESKACQSMSTFSTTVKLNLHQLLSNSIFINWCGAIKG
ncbi:TPA: hypothetical protein U9B20_000906 [Streptococcus agalactiae]|nr:hypothetical protein [Streptococcus agalactiae]